MIVPPNVKSNSYQIPQYANLEIERAILTCGEKGLIGDTGMVETRKAAKSMPTRIPLTTSIQQAISDNISSSYLSLHCFPILPRKCLAMSDHLLGPYLATNSTTLSSSSLVQGPFTISGFNTFCHRC